MSGSTDHTLSADEFACSDDAACGLVRTDGKGLILAANRTFCGWVGFEKAELVGRRRVQDLFTVGARIFHQTHWAPLLQLQGSVAEVKLEVKHRDGSTLPMIFNAVRREREGVVRHDLAMFIARDRDVYERELVSSREELRLLVHEATRLEELAKDRALFAEQMIGIVSHDLRNPLSAIHLGILALSRGDLTSNQVRVLGRISRSTERAHRLIADLLDFTAARMGKGLSVKRKDADPHGLVAEALDELRTAFPHQRFDHERHGKGMCHVDPDRIAQLLGNLISNAVAYGDPLRAITVTSRVDADGSAQLSVHNHGSHIPADAVPNLFQPMVRGDVGGAARSVGLGLYIVSEIAAAHDGVMSVRSIEGEGTTFLATFPCGDQSKSAPP